MKFILAFLLLSISSLSIFAQNAVELGSYEIKSTSSASIDLGNDSIELTPKRYTSGAIWFDKPIDLTEDFDIRVAMNFDDNFCWLCRQDGSNIYPEHGGGGDGIAFVLTNSPDSMDIIGENMGFARFSPSFAVEFDPLFHFAQDPLYDHIGLVNDGDVDLVCDEDPSQHWSGTPCPNYLKGATNFWGGTNTTDLLVPGIGTDPASIEDSFHDGEFHLARMTWVAETGTFEVWFDCELKISTTNNNLIDSIFSGDSTVYVGFTSSTADDYSRQVIHLNPEHDENYCTTLSNMKKEFEQMTATISPNPSTGIFYIDFNSNENHTIQVFNLFGQAIYNGQSNGKGDFEMDLSNIEKGVYFFTTTYNNKKLSKKLIIK